MGIILNQKSQPHGKSGCYGKIESMKSNKHQAYIKRFILVLITLFLLFGCMAVPQNNPTLPNSSSNICRNKADLMTISQIQGASHRSPYDGQEVHCVTGIVTAVDGGGAMHMRAQVGQRAVGLRSGFQSRRQRHEEGLDGERALGLPPAVDGGLAGAGTCGHALDRETGESTFLEDLVGGLEDGGAGFV